MDTQPEQLFAPGNEPICDSNDGHDHDRYVMYNPSLAGKRAGLMWIGEKFYTPAEFIREARQVGISKKIASIPRGFEFGKDIIYLSHIKAMVDYDNEDDPFNPGIFMSFKSERVDLVIDDPDNIPTKAIVLKEKFGDRARLVKVEQDQISFL